MLNHIRFVSSYSHTTKLVRFYQGVDGLKTGYTEGAGYCLTATAKKTNMRLIATVMGEQSSTTRNAEVTSMLDFGFAQYKAEQILKKENVLAKVEVDKGKTRQVEIIPKSDINIVMKKTEKLGKISYDLKLDTLKAPIKQGDEIGTLYIKQDGKELNQVKVTITKDLKKANFLELFFRYFTDITTGSVKF